MYVPLCPPRFLLLCCRPFSLFVISLQLLCVRLMHSSGITAEDEGHIEWVKRPSVTNNAHILSPSTTLPVVYWTEWFCLHKVLHIFVFTCKLKREISLKIIQYSILTSIKYFQHLENLVCWCLWTNSCCLFFHNTFTMIKTLANIYKWQKNRTEKAKQQDENIYM